MAAFGHSEGLIALATVGPFVIRHIDSLKLLHNLVLSYRRQLSLLKLISRGAPSSVRVDTLVLISDKSLLARRRCLAKLGGTIAPVEGLQRLLLVLRDPLHDLLINAIDQLLVLFFKVLYHIACRGILGVELLTVRFPVEELVLEVKVVGTSLLKLEVCLLKLEL